MSTDPDPSAAAAGQEQAAALVAVLLLTARQEPASAGDERTPGASWAARDRLVRPHVSPGHDAWRGSGLPR